MKMNLYSLYDKTSEEFNAPFMVKNDKLAIKAVNTFIDSKNNQITADDFDLFCVGVFDTDNGKVEALFSPVDFKNEVKENG